MAATGLSASCWPRDECLPERHVNDARCRRDDVSFKRLKEKRENGRQFRKRTIYGRAVSYVMVYRRINIGVKYHERKMGFILGAERLPRQKYAAFDRFVYRTKGAMTFD